MDAERSIYDKGYVTVENGQITGVGPKESCPAPEGFNEVFDVEGMIVTPGLINCHQHHWYTLFKGISEGMFLEDWLRDVLLPLSGAMTPGDLASGAYVAGLEMLMTGTTSFMNHSIMETGPEGVAASIDPFIELGIRQLFCKELRTPNGRPVDEAISEFNDVLNRWDGAGNGLVKIGMVIENAAHWLRTGVTSEQLIVDGWQIAREKNLRISNHITGATIWRAIKDRIQAEGRNDVEHLMGLGVLGPEWVLIHCVWMNDREIDYCARMGAHVVVCPASGAYTAGGAAPIRTFIDKGINVAIGSDGPMLNDTVDMVEQMKHTAVLQNLKYMTAGVIPTEELLEMVTIRAAEAMGMSDQIGSLEVGKRADIAVFDMQKPHWGVPLRPIAGLVLTGKGTDAAYVMVDGQIRVRNGRFVGSVDPLEVRREAEGRAQSLVQKLNLDRFQNRPWPTELRRSVRK